MSRARTGIQKGGDSSNEDSVTRQSVSFKTRAVETVEIRGERERERDVPSRVQNGARRQNTN